MVLSICKVSVMKIKLRALMSSIFICSLIITGYPSTAFASETYDPADYYSVSKSFDCPTTDTGYSADVIIYNSNDEVVRSKNISASATTDEFGDCALVDVSGDTNVPSRPGWYTVKIALYDDFGDEVDYSTSTIRVLGETPKPKPSYSTQVTIDEMSWEPAVPVDAKAAPYVKVKFRSYSRNAGNFKSKYCPKSIKVQYHKVGSGWRNLKVVSRSALRCARGASYGTRLLRFQSPGRGYLRVVVDGKLSSRAPIAFIKALNKFRFTQSWSNAGKLKWAGESAYVGAYLQQQLENGAWVIPHTGRIHVKLSKLRKGAWVNAGSCRGYDGSGWTWTYCPAVTNVQNLKLRMSYKGAVFTSPAFTAKPVKAKKLYLATDGWPSCSYAKGMLVRAGVKGSDGREWAKRTKIVLQFRSSRYDAWENVDFDFNTLRNYARLFVNSTQCSTEGWFRLYAPEYGLKLESGFFS